MPQLEKAKLQAVRADRNNSPLGEEMDVQFNPTSLRLRLTNQTEGGRSRGRQRRQHTGSSSTVLTLQLVFDSADETTGDAATPQAVSVRSKTAMVEQFVVPRRDGSETPPLVKFSWNELVVIGIVENVDIEFDHFAADGVPLRARISLAIKEQDPKYQYLEIGAGARDNANAQAAGAGSAGQPGAGTNDGAAAANPNRVAQALAGETAPEFAARLGLDPLAWRGLDVDLSAGLELEAGLEVGFSADLSLNGGIGFSAGFQAEAEVTLEASFGLEAKGGGTGAFGAGLSANASAGFALSSAGGVGAAIASVKSIKAQTATQAAKEAFSPPGQVSMTASSASAGAAATVTPDSSSKSAIASAMAASSASSATRATVPDAASDVALLKSLQRPRPERTPLVASGRTTHSAQQAASAAAQVPPPDPRATGFGYGVPLRPRIKTSQDQVQPSVCGSGSRVTSNVETGPPFASDPTMAPWKQLPARDEGRQLADRAQAVKQAHPCEVLYHNRKTGGTR